MKHMKHIKRRLDEWAWWRTTATLGWGIQRADETADIIQRRNDTHADPVLAEVMGIDRMQSDALDMDNLIRELPKRQRYYLYRLYIYRERLTDIAADLNVTKGAVSKSLSQAYRKLKDSLDSAGKLADNMSQAA